jgi:Asp-tRNA(Asn)/Glu-tRNA(Gln) amidotransferase A subunit family amidase
MDWTPKSAIEMARGMEEGRLTSEGIVGECLERIRAKEDDVRAWTFLDPDYALDQARGLDAERRSGRLRGRLHGIPVAVKDIFDTVDMPTENGTVLHAGRQPARDASAVAFLKSAGAVIMGKTVTTELALYGPGKTRNPCHPEHTPGGSSSGSAAAVASGMVPLAIGSQTNGSIIRPASFCGVIGFKPSHGAISRQGVLKLSRILDHVGIFARSLEEAALLSRELMLHDVADPDMRGHARRSFCDLSNTAPAPPLLAFVRTPAWPCATEELAEGFANLTAALGGQVEEVSLPDLFDQALADHQTIMEADIAVNLGEEYRRGAGRLSPLLCEMIERGGRITARDYLLATERIPLLKQVLDDLFSRYDAIITPATPGSAPRGLASTGSPVFCSLWTLCGVPALSLPLLTGREGLPIGVQLVGRQGEDAKLLRTAAWLCRYFQVKPGGGSAIDPARPTEGEEERP